MTERRPTLAELLAYQRERWPRGERVLVETYLQLHPYLDREAALDLIYNEIFLREQQGEAAPPEEYLQRFPQWADDLQLQFEVHQAIKPAAPAEQVPGYELLAEIGRGAMGIVYRARDRQHGRPAAIKMLRPDKFQNRPALRRFLAESRALTLLTHRHIVPIHEVGEGPAGPYLVMELIEGPSLDTLAQDGRLSPTAAVEALLPVVEAVEHAHRQGIIHRDLKPSNILLSPERGPVVLDFGMAKVRRLKPAPSAISTSTQPGMVVGTPAYMPPEQTGTDLSPPGPYSDVYSLGAILYTLLTGRPPYDEGNAIDTILKVRGPDLPPPPRHLRPDVPAALEQICMKCLSKLPEDRYPTAQTLADALRALQPGAAPPAELAPAPAGWACLVTEDTGQTFHLTRPTTVLGRSASCDVVLPDPAVSRRHFRIERGADGVSVDDLGSTRGTFVNGQRVTSSPLQDGDRLEIAGLALVFRVSS